MKMLSETVKQMLDALAHAHAADYLSQREKMRVLSGHAGLIEELPREPETAVVETGSKARRVALYLGSELPDEVMKYVIQTCARLRHELTVLTFESAQTGRSLLSPYEEALREAGVEMQLVTLQGDPVTGLRRYLRRHPEVAFLACKDSGYFGRSFLNGTRSGHSLPVPVVVVATENQAKGSRFEPAEGQDGQGAAIA